MISTVLLVADFQPSGASVASSENRMGLVLYTKQKN